MAHCKDLPIGRYAMRLAVEMEVAVRGFPRYHKDTLGTELRQAAHLIGQDVAHAARWAPSRLQTLQRLVEGIEALQISEQLAKELRVYANFAQFQRVVELAVLVGRQHGGWLNRVQGLAHAWLQDHGYIHQDLCGRRVAGLWQPGGGLRLRHCQHAGLRPSRSRRGGYGCAATSIRPSKES